MADQQPTAFGDAPWKQKAATPVVPAPANAAPAAAVPAAPTPAPAATPPSASDLILQHLGQGGIGSDQVAAPSAAPAPPSAGDIMLRHLMQMPGVSSAISGLSTQFGPPPDLSRPQTYSDWLTRHYDPSITDIGTTYASGLTAGQLATPSWALEKAGVPLPQAVSSEAIRNYVAGARERTGPAAPVIETGGLISNPYIGKGLGALGDWATSEIGLPAEAAAQKYLPEAVSKYLPQGLIPRVVSGGSQSSALSAANTFGAGGDPGEILKSAASAFPTGATIAGVVPAVKGVTPADVTAANAARLKALQDQLTKTTIPEHELHFSIDGNQNPSVADVLDYKNEIQAMKPDDSGIAAQPVLLKDIEKTIGPGTTAGNLIKAHADATQQYNNALMGQRWMNRADTDDVRGEARAQMNRPGFDPAKEGLDPLQNAFKAIGSVPDPPAARPLSPLARNAFVGGGAAVGSAAGELGLGQFGLGGHGYGATGGAAPGAVAGQKLADIIDWFRRPTPLAPAIQQVVRSQYPTMTGHALAPANDDLARALLYLNQGLR